METGSEAAIPQVEAALVCASRAMFAEASMDLMREDGVCLRPLSRRTRCLQQRITRSDCRREKAFLARRSQEELRQIDLMF